MSLFVQQQHTICEFSSSESWVILSPIEQSIKRKIEAAGTPLKDWDISIHRGVLTGCNEAFIVSTKKRNEILANCQSEDERVRTEALIRPILRGRDIKKYGYDWAGLWIIYIPWHFPLQFDETIQGESEEAEVAFQQQYPAVFSHMLQYKDVLSKRNKAETGIRYEWYALQRWGAKYWEDFEKPKIIYPDICNGMSFCLDFDQYYLSNTGYFITTKDEATLQYLTHTLNSEIIEWYYRTLSVQLGTQAVRMFSIYVLNIPIPPVNKEDLSDVLNLSQKEREFIFHTKV